MWFQLYPTADWNITRALVKRAEAAGCPVVAITVDNPTSAGRETLARGRRLDSRDCSTCHSTEPGGAYRRKPMFDGIDTTKLTSTLTAHLTWDFVHRLQDITSMKIVLKGIVTAEDATLALSHGVNGLIVSNHGGRGEESARSTIEALPEVVEVIGGRIPVLVDSGFRRGTDICKVPPGTSRPRNRSRKRAGSRKCSTVSNVGATFSSTGTRESSTRTTLSCAWRGPEASSSPATP